MQPFSRPNPRTLRNTIRSSGLTAALATIIMSCGGGGTDTPPLLLEDLYGKVVLDYKEIFSSRNFSETFNFSAQSVVKFEGDTRDYLRSSNQNGDDAICFVGALRGAVNSGPRFQCLVFRNDNSEDWFIFGAIVNGQATGTHESCETAQKELDNCANTRFDIISNPDSILQVSVTPSAAIGQSLTQRVVLTGQALFPENSAVLTANGFSSWQTLVDRLETYSVIEKIDLIGHSANIGTTAENVALSLNRARFLETLLLDRFPDVPITVSGAGSADPLTESGQNKDDRVDIRVEAINQGE